MTTIVSSPLTNHAYGFPRGAVRSHTPHILAVVHITANLASAVDQRHYANRAASPGPSAHVYLDRDGSGIRAIDEVRFAAWSNGDVKSPAIANAGVATIVKHRAAGRNANECCWLEIECVGEATTAGQITPAQLETVAQLVALESKRTGIPPARTTILTHADIDSVDRANCAFLPARREAQMKILIDRVRVILTPPPPPVVRETVTLVVTGDKPLAVTKTATLVSVAGKNLTVS